MPVRGSSPADDAGVAAARAAARELEVVVPAADPEDVPEPDEPETLGAWAVDGIGVTAGVDELELVCPASGSEYCSSPAS